MLRARLVTSGICRRLSSKADVSSKRFANVYSPNTFPAVANDKLTPLDTFVRRHVGPNTTEVNHMLKTLGYSDLQDFVTDIVPENILTRRPLNVGKGLTETDMVAKLKEIGGKNKLLRSYIGKGYYGTKLPAVIQRNLLECPEYYTSYTPYNPEISQGRLESLLNFQTVISDLSGLPIANASLLDEATAAAEAVTLSFNNLRKKKAIYYLDSKLHPQTVSVIQTRAGPQGIEIRTADLSTEAGIKQLEADLDNVCGAMVQYPATDGSINNYTKIGELIHSKKGLFAVASDLLALTLLKAPASFGADIVLGSSQRFGVGQGYGGPSAAFFAVQSSLSRKIPGRIVGVSKDRLDQPALRLALQTREQHIKRDKATSNICTAQALLANVSAMYAVYHGPQGLTQIAEQVYGFTAVLAEKIAAKHTIINATHFDTLSVELNGISADDLMALAVEKYGINLFKESNTSVSLSLDETVTTKDVEDLIELFTNERVSLDSITLPQFPAELRRTDKILQNPVFNDNHSETAMLRYLHHLQSKDISLANSMIPLGSCTMKLNPTVAMMPITWPEFTQVHPFVPKDQAQGYSELLGELSNDLSNITGFAATSLQPNSGAQGEYAGLTVIKAFLDSTGKNNRNICLIPVSAHGTNPASAAMANMKVVPVKCLENGSLDLVDLREKADKYKDTLAAMMVTYPSTYGLYEPKVKEAIEIVHEFGGKVYMDGANMNAQVGLTSPGDLGADVCHLNLHKTFALSHGGGGPGIGSISVTAELAPYLPRHDVVEVENATDKSIGAMTTSPYGSALVSTIPYSYIKLLGSEGLPFASTIAMLNSNYMRKRLEPYYEVLFVDGVENKSTAHEFILDMRPFKKYGLEASDVAKRLHDYGFHAPTQSFPIAGTLMIEPTESENLQELERFIEALISIRGEIDALVAGEPRGQLLKNAPHSLLDIISSKDWETRGYSREEAAYPLPYLKEKKAWPTVSRVDDTYGDLNLMCTCPSVEEVANQVD